MFFSIDGKKIFYSDSGKGNIVVLLHGYLETSDVWNGFASKLKEEFRVITIDLPGHGGSDTFGTIHTMEFMAGVVKELLRYAGVDRFFLAGHSMGGYVTLAFLDLFHSLLSGYCLFHSHPFPDTPKVTEKRMREIALVKAGKKELFCPDDISGMFADQNLGSLIETIKHLQEAALETSGDGIIAVLNGMMARPSRLSVMEEEIIPGLWILGAHDNYIPCEAIKSRVQLPGNARLVILENSGHMGFIEEEEMAVKEITDFVHRLG